MNKGHSFFTRMSVLSSLRRDDKPAEFNSAIFPNSNWHLKWILLGLSITLIKNHHFCGNVEPLTSVDSLGENAA